MVTRLTSEQRHQHHHRHRRPQRQQQKQNTTKIYWFPVLGGCGRAYVRGRGPLCLYRSLCVALCSISPSFFHGLLPKARGRQSILARSSKHPAKFPAINNNAQLREKEGGRLARGECRRSVQDPTKLREKIGGIFFEL